MKRKSIPQKLKSLLQKEIDSTCPFCGNQEVDHFQFHHIDENPINNDILNLLMLCPTCHSKITKGDISKADVESLKNKLSSEKSGGDRMAAKIINFKSKVENAVVGDNNKVTINVNKRTQKSKYPDGCIGANINKANYIGYLITRYHEYKEWHVGKENMNYAILSSNIKHKYKIGKTRTIYNIPEIKFEELAEFIHDKIDGTILAKVKKSKGELKNYLSFEEYICETNETQTSSIR